MCQNTLRKAINKFNNWRSESPSLKIHFPQFPVASPHRKKIQNREYFGIIKCDGENGKWSSTNYEKIFLGSGAKNVKRCERILCKLS